MRPVYQTQFVAECGPGAGNCWAACIASLLDRDLSDVPNFMEIVDDTARLEVERVWWREQGFMLLTIDYWDGLDLGLHIVTGKSPRGDWLHSCIANGNQIVHDPRPEGGGLADIQYRTLLVPLNPSMEVLS